MQQAFIPINIGYESWKIYVYQVDSTFVAIDISELIEAEEGTRKGELALIEQTQILQASFDAIVQDISVWDEYLNLAAWNNLYEQFMVFPDGVLYSEILFKNVVAKAAKQGILVDDLPDQKEAE